MVAGKQVLEPARRVPATRARSLPAATADADGGDEADRLDAAVARIVRSTRPARSGDALSPSQIVVLEALVERGPRRQSDLVAEDGINATLLSRVVAKLAAAGLIHRMPDPSDGRAERIEATAKGRRLCERDRQARTKRVRVELAQLDAEQRSALGAALSVLELLGQRLRDADR